MHYLGIEAALKNQPLLDPAFIPFGVWRRGYWRAFFDFQKLAANY